MQGSVNAKRVITEHKGRDADIVQIDRAQFNHQLTDFPLQDAHRALECGACHQPKALWSKATPGRPAPTAIAKDDVHHGQFEQPCGECHSSLSWSGGHFNHDQTRFARRVPMSA